VVRLLDARPAALDGAALRTWARMLTAGRGEYVSRTYRHPFALVAWHDAPVGVDIERCGRLDDAVAAVVRTPAERAAGTADLASLWSSKEALAKALGNPLELDPARLGSPVAWPDGHCGPWRALSWPAPAGHVAWVVWRVAR
jgi:hypothetical protein